MHETTNGHHATLRYEATSLLKLERIGDACATDLGDRDRDRHLVTKANGRHIVTGDRDPGPTGIDTVWQTVDDRNIRGPQELMLRRLHPEEKRREVNDPRGIRIPKLDPPLRQQRPPGVARLRGGSGHEGRLVSGGDYSPTYGSNAMKRARLMALVTAC